MRQPEPTPQNPASGFERIRYSNYPMGLRAEFPTLYISVGPGREAMMCGLVCEWQVMRSPANKGRTGDEPTRRDHLFGIWARVGCQF